MNQKDLEIWNVPYLVEKLNRCHDELKEILDPLPGELPKPFICAQAFGKALEILLTPRHPLKIKCGQTLPEECIQ